MLQLTGGPLGSADEQAFQVVRGREEFSDTAVPELERRLSLSRWRWWASDLGRDSRPLASRGGGAIVAIALHALQRAREYGLQRGADRDSGDDPPLGFHFSAASGRCLTVLVSH